MSQFFFENNDVLNFLVEPFFRFFTYDSYVIFFTLKRFYHEPLLARKIEQSLPACTFLTLNKYPSYPTAFQNDLNEREKFGWKNKKFKLHFLAEKVTYTENPKSEGGPSLRIFLIH